MRQPCAAIVIDDANECEFCFIAPTSDLNQSPEMDISTLPTVVAVRGGDVARLFDKCNAINSMCDFACQRRQQRVYQHGGALYCAGRAAHERKIRPAQDPEHLSPQEISHRSGTCGAKIVVLNACTTIAVAHYVVLDMAGYAISAAGGPAGQHRAENAAAVLSQHRRGCADDRKVVEAFTVADDEAQYAMQVAPGPLLRLLQVIDDPRADQNAGR